MVHKAQLIKLCLYFDFELGIVIFNKSDESWYLSNSKGFKIMESYYINEITAKASEYKPGASILNELPQICLN